MSLESLVEFVPLYAQGRNDGTMERWSHSSVGTPDSQRRSAGGGGLLQTAQDEDPWAWLNNVDLTGCCVLLSSWLGDKFL